MPCEQTSIDEGPLNSSTGYVRISTAGGRNTKAVHAPSIHFSTSSLLKSEDSTLSSLAISFVKIKRNHNIGHQTQEQCGHQTQEQCGHQTREQCGHQTQEQCGHQTREQCGHQTREQCGHQTQEQCGHQS